MIIAKRSFENPILLPDRSHAWEGHAAFNGCPVRAGRKIQLVYRAEGPGTFFGDLRTYGTIGCASSADGIHFTGRRLFILPEKAWERYGCEDPRVTKLGGTYYTFYTALSTNPFSADGIKVGLALSRDLKSVAEKHLVTPFNAKAMALFPKKIGSKFAAILTVDTDRPPSSIGVAFFNSEKDMWSQSYWRRWYAQLPKHAIPLRRNDQDQIEVGAPPIYTPHGWLLLYSYIQNYFSGNKTFGVEAVLLDLLDPRKVIGTGSAPLLMPEEEYEVYGRVPNIVFPSGALLEKQRIRIYYGATDTTTCTATVKTRDVLRDLRPTSPSAMFTHYENNPVLKPRKEHAWESKAVFNPAAIADGNTVHLVYRAMSEDNTSVFGYAASYNGVDFTTRFPEPIYVPRAPFELKLQPGGNSGCEDPRITRIGNMLYMCYTAYDGVHAPRVALTHIAYADFLAHRWTWSQPVLISPPDHDDKDAALFPGKIGGKYVFLHRLDGTHIWIDFRDSLDFAEGEYLGGKVLMSPRRGIRDSRKIGIASPPIKTSAGWLLIYHGVSKKDDHHYHVRAALLDLKDPRKVLSRTKDPILEPELRYEREGQVANVVFPCGAAVRGGMLYAYYGGADSVIGVSYVGLRKLLQELKLRIGLDD